MPNLTEQEEEEVDWRENFRQALVETFPGVKLIDSSGSMLSRAREVSPAELRKILENKNLHLMSIDHQLDEHGFKPLERMASDDNLQGVKRLVRAGENTLIHHHGLFPYHFASSNEVFKLLTHPPIEWRAFMLTLARSTVSQQNKIEMLLSARMNEIPLDFLYSDKNGVTCFDTAAQKAEAQFARLCLDCLLDDLNSDYEQKSSNVTKRVRQLQANNNQLKIENEELAKRDTELKKKWLRKFKDRENEIKEENRKHKIEVEKLKEQIDEDKKKNSRGWSDKKVTELEDVVKKLMIEKQDLKIELEQTQERLVCSTKGAETAKKQAQARIRQLAEILHETAREFEVESYFESNSNVKDLEGQIAALKTINSNLETISKKYDQMTTCCICEEKYESAGERSAVKLKCSHIICGFCANIWLTQKGSKASCPTCRETYRSGDIRAVNLNTDF